MPDTHHVFARTLEKSYAWLDEIRAQLGAQATRAEALAAFRAVIHALRDRLPADEAVDLAAQLPLILRGVYYESWRPDRGPDHLRTPAELVGRVAAELVPRDLDPEHALEVVFRTVARHVSWGEVRDIEQNLPRALRALWPNLPA